MESRRRISTQFLIFLGISLMLFCCVNAENITFPEANVILLAPFYQWRSAFYCLNISVAKASCPAKYALDMSGWLNVTNEDKAVFCEEGGCADHTRAVLDCINHVKRDFWFANKATVNDLNNYIHNGCTSPQGFSGPLSITSGGYRINSASIVSVLLALLLLAILHM